MKTYMQAIATEEGFYVAGTLAQRRNNPGNIVEGSWAQLNGALPSDGNRFAAWPDPDSGFAAMRSLLTEHYLGLTIAQAISKWAPPIENRTDLYLQNVLNWTGLSARVQLTAELLA